MKIIEALKQLKDLARKADDIVDKVKIYCADLDNEEPMYQDQKQQVREWIQSHSDILKEILRLRIAIQRTNLATQVTIQFNDKSVTKSIAEWIHRRKDLSGAEIKSWNALTTKNLQESYKQQTTTLGQEKIIKRRLYYDPREKDLKIDMLKSEPLIIDSKLEVINAITDLIEI